MKGAVLVLSAWLFLISTSNVHCDDGNFKSFKPRTSCDYEPVVLLTGIGKLYNLHIHRVTNILFFSFVKNQEYDFQIGSYNLNSNEFNSIPGLEGGCSVAIDRSNDVIYLGGSNGIFIYNQLTKIADAYAEQDRNIWAMYYKHKLFYIRYPKQTLYIQIGNKFSTVKEFEDLEVDTFFMGSRGEILYANKTGFFAFHPDVMNTTLINKFWHVRQITEDNLNNVYVATNSGVFVYTSGSESKISKVLNYKDVLGLAFDKYNNIIYSSGSNITMLKFNENCNSMAPEQ